MFTPGMLKFNRIDIEEVCNTSLAKSRFILKLIENTVDTDQMAPDESKKEGKDQELIQSSTTPEPGYQWESENFTIIHHKREPRGYWFPSRLPQGINKQTLMKA